MKELEKIDEDRRRAELDKLRSREDNERFRRYNENLKEKLASHQQTKYQELQEKMDRAKQEQIQ